MNLPIKINLPNGFLDTEERCGYTVRHEIKAAWAVELDLLVELDRVCKKYEIKYFAEGGTILGAVRHKGFIPWDDDIDIAMDRNEYIKLCKHQDEFKAPYFFQTNYTDPCSLRGHAQLRNSLTTGALKSEASSVPFNQGIFIDIFPLDRVPNDELKFQKQKNTLSKLKKAADIIGRGKYDYNFNTTVSSCVKKLISLGFTPFGMSKYISGYFFDKFDKECQIYNKDDTKLISLLSFRCTWKRLLRDRAAYDNYLMMPFEFLDIPVPIGYADVLTNLYGDYNKIVMGNSAHGAIIFDPYTPYNKYLKEHYGNKYY